MNSHPVRCCLFNGWMVLATLLSLGEGLGVRGSLGVRGPFPLPWEREWPAHSRLVQYRLAVSAYFPLSHPLVTSLPRLSAPYRRRAKAVVPPEE